MAGVPQKGVGSGADGRDSDVKLMFNIHVVSQASFAMQNVQIILSIFHEQRRKIS